MPKPSKTHKNSRITKLTDPKNSIKQLLQTVNINPTTAGKLTTDLNNIVEVTQENQHETNRFDTITQEVQTLIANGELQRGVVSRLFGCIRGCLGIFRNDKQSEFSINVKQQQLIKTIERLRLENYKNKPVLPPIDHQYNGIKITKTLILDIDQTLVYSSQTELDHYDFTFTMPYKKTDMRVYTKNRFGLESFLFEMSKFYEIIIYTTNIKEYADNVLKNIDKKKRISHVLYKDKCVNLNKIHYLKNLKILGRNPQTTIIIDHNIASGILQPRNFLQIKAFTGEKHDREIVKLIPFLRELAQMECIVPVNQIYEEYWNRQIRLKFNSIDKGSGNFNEQNGGDQDYGCDQDGESEGSYRDKRQRERQRERQKYYGNCSSNSVGKRNRYSHRKINSELESLANNQENQRQFQRQRQNQRQRQKQKEREKERERDRQNRLINQQKLRKTQQTQATNNHSSSQKTIKKQTKHQLQHQHQHQHQISHQDPNSIEPKYQHHIRQQKVLNDEQPQQQQPQQQSQKQPEQSLEHEQQYPLQFQLTAQNSENNPIHTKFISLKFLSQPQLQAQCQQNQNIQQQQIQDEQAPSQSTQHPQQQSYIPPCKIQVEYDNKDNSRNQSKELRNNKQNIKSKTQKQIYVHHPDRFYGKQLENIDPSLQYLQPNPNTNTNKKVYSKSTKSINNNINTKLETSNNKQGDEYEIQESESQSQFVFKNIDINL